MTVSSPADNIIITHFCLYLIAEGVFHQYDSIAYPNIISKTPSSSRFFKIVKIVSNVGTAIYYKAVGPPTMDTTKDSKFEPPEQESMQALALTVHLEEYKTRLCDFNFDSLDVQSTTEEILNRFQSFRCVRSARNEWENSVFVCKGLLKVRTYIIT